jgi:hypothetical protein
MSDDRPVPAILILGSVRKSCRLILISEELTSEVLDNARSGRVAGWTMAADAPEFYRVQMASRVRVTTTNKAGQKVLEWRTVGKQGEHCWDGERYVFGVATMTGWFNLDESPDVVSENGTETPVGEEWKAPEHINQTPES